MRLTKNQRIEFISYIKNIANNMIKDNPAISNYEFDTIEYNYLSLKFIDLFYLMRSESRKIIFDNVTYISDWYIDAYQSNLKYQQLKFIDIQVDKNLLDLFYNLKDTQQDNLIKRGLSDIIKTKI